MTTKILPRVTPKTQQLKPAAAKPSRMVQPRFDLINTKASLSDALSLGFATIAKKVSRIFK